MKIEFDNNFQKKVMIVRFPEGASFKSIEDIRFLRGEWTKALGSWHSPYKALVDLTSVNATSTPEMTEEWKRLLNFLKGFFLKSSYAYSWDTSLGECSLPFEIIPEQEARDRVGLSKVPIAKAGDLRSIISISNHFQQHVMEVSFDAPAHFKTKEDLQTLKSKITNNLMQWHSAWNLLIDCSNFTVEENLATDFETMTKYFKSFFLKQILGYSPKGSKQEYPFQVFRARHSAAGRLEAEGLTSGQDADCNSRKG